MYQVPAGREAVQEQTPLTYYDDSRQTHTQIYKHAVHVSGMRQECQAGGRGERREWGGRRERRGGGRRRRSVN